MAPMVQPSMFMCTKLGTNLTNHTINVNTHIQKTLYQQQLIQYNVALSKVRYMYSLPYYNHDMHDIGFNIYNT